MNDEKYEIFFAFFHFHFFVVCALALSFIHKVSSIVSVYTLPSLYNTHFAQNFFLFLRKCVYIHLYESERNAFVLLLYTCIFAFKNSDGKSFFCNKKKVKWVREIYSSLSAELLSRFTGNSSYSLFFIYNFIFLLCARVVMKFHFEEDSSFQSFFYVSWSSFIFFYYGIKLLNICKLQCVN